MDDGWKVYLVTYDKASQSESIEKKALLKVLKDWGAVPICKSVWLIKTKDSSTTVLCEELAEAAGFSCEGLSNDRFFFTQITGTTEFINTIFDTEELRDYLDGVGGIKFLWG